MYILFQLKLNDLSPSALHLLLMYGFADPTAMGAHVEFLVCSDSLSPFLESSSSASSSLAFQDGLHFCFLMNDPPTTFH